MNRTEQTLLKTLELLLWDKPLRNVSAIDWNAILSEAYDQSILGIIIKAVPESEFDSLDSKWISYRYKVLSQNILYYDAQDKLDKLLNDNNIKYAILKGAAAAVEYIDPYSRTMGDIDFIVPKDQVQLAEELMINNGYILSNHLSTRHLGLSKEGTSYELHRWFSYDGLDIEEYIQNGLLHTERNQIEGHAFNMLPEAENGLVLLTHIWRHVQSGIGLRQIIDWLYYANSFLNDNNWQMNFEPIVKEKGLKTLAITVTRLCQIYLGLTESITWCKTADEDVCALLMETIMSFGNFGKKSDSGVGRTLQSVACLKDRGVFRHLQIRGEANWTAYYKHHWLRPFAWLYQLTRYFRKGLGSRNIISVFYGIKKSKNHYALIKELGINIGSRNDNV